jgi:DNA-binding MarR family transcriptional regulator
MTSQRDRRPLSGDDLETWSALATLLEWLPPALDAQLSRDSDLTHFEYGILYALADSDDRMLRMSTLAGYANSSLSRLSRAVSRLEAKNWVERRADPHDGRSTLASLTELGFATFEQASPGHAETVRRLVLAPLSAAQIRQLRDISRRITGAIQGDGGWRPLSRVPE